MVYTRDEAIDLVRSFCPERQGGSNERHLGHSGLADEGYDGHGRKDSGLTGLSLRQWQR